jgi:hypothetical protein
MVKRRMFGNEIADPNDHIRFGLVLTEYISGLWERRNLLNTNKLTESIWLSSCLQSYGRNSQVC